MTWHWLELAYTIACAVKHSWVGNSRRAAINQSINPSKFIFQAMTNNCNTINVAALERLPEKHYAL